MPVACLYDIHGNLPALEAVLEEVRQSEADHIVVGGDLVPDPFQECFDLLNSLDLPTEFIIGNGNRETLAAKRGGVTSAVPAYFTRPWPGTPRNSPKPTPRRLPSGR